MSFIKENRSQLCLILLILWLLIGVAFWGAHITLLYPYNMFPEILLGFIVYTLLHVWFGLIAWIVIINLLFKLVS